MEEILEEGYFGDQNSGSEVRSEGHARMLRCSCRFEALAGSAHAQEMMGSRPLQLVVQRSRWGWPALEQGAAVAAEQAVQRLFRVSDRWEASSRAEVEE